jgi:hypothetical protein
MDGTSGHAEMDERMARERESDVPTIRGIYDGSAIHPIEPLGLPADTIVEILIPEPVEDAEQRFWQRLIELGLITDVRHGIVADEPFEPIPYSGAPVSQTIIDERR